MKYLIASFLLFYNFIYSQHAKVGDYHLLMYDKAFDVVAQLNLNDKIIYKIETPRKEGLYDYLWLIIKPNRLDRFINLLDNAIETFPKWEATALNNGVENITRQILPYKDPKIKAIFTYGNTIYMDSLVLPIAVFNVENGRCFLEVRSTYWMMSDFNQYITAEPFRIRFNNIEEIKELKSLLNDDLAYDKIIAKMEQEDLFQQN